MQWFADWFNSPYYHLLYNKRDDTEAGIFIDNLCHKLSFRDEAKVWDLACGKGRHSFVLRSKGLNVTGTDLSPESIAFANSHKKDGMDFLVHDMREHFRTGYFDAVFNLFTSIGYFENISD